MKLSALPRQIPPALALFVVAPVFGELFSGSSPLNEFINPVTFLSLALLYGCGAILCRELVVRWDKGWASLFLLGLAYGIYEEGMLVQSFFDPTWPDLGSLAVYGRVAGVNWVWAEHLSLFHALVSIAASIAFVEMLFPAQRWERWVTSRRLWLANWAGFIGIYAVWEALTTYDPGIWKLVSLLAVLGLGLAARLLPGRRKNAVHPASLDGSQRLKAQPLRFFALGFLGMFGQFFIVYNGSDRQAYHFLFTMLLLAVYDLALLWMAWRWSKRFTGWDDRHRLALITGGLSLLLVLGPLTVGQQYPVMYYTHPGYLFLLGLVYRQVNGRYGQVGAAG